MHSFRLLFLIQQRFGALLSMPSSVGFMMVIHVREMLSESQTGSQNSEMGHASFRETSGKLLCMTSVFLSSDSCYGSRGENENAFQGKPWQVRQVSAFIVRILSVFGDLW